MNILYYVPHHKILGGYFMPYISINVANGSLVADITGTNLSANGGGGGFADLFRRRLGTRTHDRIRRFVDVEDSQTATSQEIGCDAGENPA